MNKHDVTMFAAGAASLPAAAGATWATVALSQKITDEVRAFRERHTRFRGTRVRSLNAAAIMNARTFWVVRVPGGLVMYRSIVPWTIDVMNDAKEIRNIRRAPEDQA